MNKKFSMLIALLAATLLVSAFALVGCGGQDGENSQGSETESKPAAEQTASSQESEDSDSDSADMKLLNEGKLTSASDFAFPPFEYMDEQGVHQGFSVELIDAVAKKMGLEAEFTDPLKFDTLVPLTKQGGKFDIAVASITITDKRKEDIDFTDAYLDSNQALAALESSNVKSEADANQEGVKVGVQSGTSGQVWAEENLTNAEIVIMEEVPAIFSAIQAGQLDAAVVDLPVTAWLVKNSYQDVAIVEEIPTGEQYGMAVSKDNPALKDALNKALEEIKEDGTYDTIYNKYFGE